MSNLTPHQKELFDALHDTKVRDYETFSKEEYGGLFASVIDKYPESAHFIYELLQNAEDANASWVDIVLRRDCLVFKHNGTKHFDVTPKGSETLGDINSITGLGYSSKNRNGEQVLGSRKIGKFGVGFKSVFQYTDSPEIYDDTYCFKIENYIIPTLLDHDDPSRQKGETLFVFRFKSQMENLSFEQISRRLQDLDSPLLFLANIKRISCCIELSSGIVKNTKYEKELLEIEEHGLITLERYRLVEPMGTCNIILFSRMFKIEGEEEGKGDYPVYVGFFYDENKGQLITDIKRKVHCYFPTSVSFDTCFIVHAPFLLTDNRHALKPEVYINKRLVNALADLAVQSVVILRDYGIKCHKLIINENITEICPQYVHDQDFYYGIYKRPFSESFRNILRDEPLLLSRNEKYLTPDKAYIPQNKIYDLLKQDQFELLRSLGNDSGGISEGVDFLQRELASRIKGINDYCDYYKAVSRFEIADLGREITAPFMNAMNFEWVVRFYNFLHDNASIHINISGQSKGEELVFRSAPIVKTQKNEWVAPYINKTIPNVYLPLEGDTNISTDYNFVNSEYLGNEYAERFFTQLELKKPDEFDYIRSVVLQKYQSGDADDIDCDVLQDDFNILVNYYQTVRETEKKDAFINMAKESLLLVGVDNTLYKPSELFVESPLFIKYFDGSLQYSVFNHSFYRRKNQDDKISVIDEFIRQLGAQTAPRVVTETLVYRSTLPSHIKQALEEISPFEFRSVKDPQLQGFDKAYQRNNITKEISIYLFME